MSDLELALLPLGAVMILMLATWAASLVRRDASLVDRAWGLAFVVMAWVLVAMTGANGRLPLAAGLVTVWGLRLTVHITSRNWGHGEDPRYAAMRAKHPETFAVRSLVTVFALQGVLAWLVAVPLYGMAVLQDGVLGWLDALGVVVWAIGFFFEAVGDWQLSRFLADEANRGKVLDTGLWRFTRHPNYFGDATMWWGIGLLSLAAGAWWGLLGPLGMTVVILKVSGVALTDRNMATRSRREPSSPCRPRVPRRAPGSVRPRWPTRRSPSTARRGTRWSSMRGPTSRTRSAGCSGSRRMARSNTSGSPTPSGR
jgi:steroid 5-alpha reductase family enzyme